MACDFAALGSIDAGDPERTAALLHECVGVLTSPDLWLWAIVFTVVCGVVGAIIGKYKNAIVRDTILGLALGPIGWIISANLPARTAPRTCAACKGVVQPGDAHCRHCGAKLIA